MEHDLCIVAELHQSDLREISVDRERLYDPFSEAEHLNVPVVVSLDDDACGLVKHQHNVGRLRTRHVRHYEAHTFNSNEINLKSSRRAQTSAKAGP